MIRTLMWFTLFILFLGFVSIHVKYKDGLTIDFNGWGKKDE